MQQLFTRDLWREALRLQHREFLVWPALREVVGIALVYGLAALYLGPDGKGLALNAAAGALMAGMASVTGPSRTRSRILLGMTGMLGLGVGLGTLVSDTPLLAAGVALAATFGLAMLEAANPLYQGITVISVSYMVTYAGQPTDAGTASQWWMHSLAIILGGLLQMLYLSWLWPLRPFSPEYEQLAQVYRDLAVKLRGWPQRLTNDAGGTGTQAGRHHSAEPGLMLHHSSNLAQAQTVTVERYPAKWHATQFELARLLDRLYDLDAALTGYRVSAAHWLEAQDSAAQDSGVQASEAWPSEAHSTLSAAKGLNRQSEQLADLLERFADQIEAAQDTEPAQPGLGTKHCQNLLSPSNHDWTEWQAALHGSPASLRLPASSVLAAVSALREDVHTPQLSVQQRAAEPIWDELLRPWRDSHRVKFSAYYALSIGALTYLSHLLPWNNSSWLVMTYALIFSSDYQRLLTRGAARVLGTLAAMLLIVLLQRVLGMSEAVSLTLLLVSSYLVVATVEAGYLAVTVAFTVYAFATMNYWEVDMAMDNRLAFTAGGVAAAVLAYQLWPNWHVKNLPQRRTAAVQSLHEFLAAQHQFLEQRQALEQCEQPQAAAPHTPHTPADLLPAADQMRRKLLDMGRDFKDMAEVAAASQSEPVWKEQLRGQAEAEAGAGPDPLRELATLEHLAAEAAGIYAGLIGDTTDAAQAAAQLESLKQRLSDLELSEVPRPTAPLVGRLG